VLVKKKAVLRLGKALDRLATREAMKKKKGAEPGKGNIQSKGVSHLKKPRKTGKRARPLQSAVGIKEGRAVLREKERDGATRKANWKNDQPPAEKQQ